MGLIHRGVLHFTLTELDQRPPGWDEELSMALAGLAAAEKVVADRQKHRGGQQAPETGQAVYGMPGKRFDPQGGFR